MPFAGLPEQALVFHEGLLADDTRAYWTDHRAGYDRCVAAPLRALLDELGPEFGEREVFRPYRDVRMAWLRDHVGPSRAAPRPAR